MFIQIAYLREKLILILNESELVRAIKRGSKGRKEGRRE
jgi:hypothetical protein